MKYESSRTNYLPRQRNVVRTVLGAFSKLTLQKSFSIWLPVFSHYFLAIPEISGPFQSLLLNNILRTHVLSGAFKNIPSHRTKPFGFIISVKGSRTTIVDKRNSLKLQPLKKKSVQLNRVKSKINWPELIGSWRDSIQGVDQIRDYRLQR